MSLSSRRAWCSSALMPVCRKSWRLLCPTPRPVSDPQPGALFAVDQFHLVGIEAELVEPAQPLGDTVPLILGADSSSLVSSSHKPRYWRTSSSLTSIGSTSSGSSSPA